MDKNIKKLIWVTFRKEGLHKYPARDIEIEVSEDGENGSYAIYHKGQDEVRSDT